MKKFMNNARNTITFKALQAKSKLIEHKAEGYVDHAKRMNAFYE